MMHTEEDRRDHDITIDRDSDKIYYDRDARTPKREYISPDLDAVVHILKARRRQVLIRRLAELHDEADGRRTISHEQLAREIAAIEDDVEPEMVNWRSLRSVKSGIRHHFSVLEDLNAITWHKDDQAIETTPDTCRYASLLEDVEEVAESVEIAALDEWRDPPW